MLARQLSFLAPAAVLSAWATVMLHTIYTGHINRLLSPLFRPYVVVAAALLLGLSVLYVLLYQPEGGSISTAQRLRQMGRWLVLLVPVVAASILSPTALSSTTMVNRNAGPAGVAAMPSWNAATEANAKKALDADPHQPVPVEVTDLITLSHSASQTAAFDGRKVKVVGLFSTAPDAPPKLVRWIMWCCAADAQPAAVELTGHTSGTWSPTQWLEVVGTAHFPTVSGHVVPRIEVESISPTQEPDEPFLSP